MKSKQLLSIATALCMTAASSNAAVVVTQFVGFVDGNDGGGTDPLVGFDVVNANSILIATVYIDSPTPSLSNARFGTGGGIGSGDVAPTLTITDSRLISYVFINPSITSGLSFRATATVGTAAILYEVSGANTSLSSITTATNSTTIATATLNELIVSFAGRNPGTLTEAGFFTGADLNIGGNGVGTGVTGAGNIASASAAAPSIGSYNITWTGSNAAGRIAYAFEEAPAIPEPSSALLGGLGLLVLLRRRR